MQVVLLSSFDSFLDHVIFSVESITMTSYFKDKLSLSLRAHPMKILSKVLSALAYKSFNAIIILC